MGKSLYFHFNFTGGLHPFSLRCDLFAYFQLDRDHFKVKMIIRIKYNYCLYVYEFIYSYILYN